MSKSQEIKMIIDTIEDLESQKAKYDNYMSVGNEVMNIIDNTITELSCLLRDEFDVEY